LKYFYLLLFFNLYFVPSYSQEIVWSKQIKSTYYYSETIADHNGHVYDFGMRSYNYSNSLTPQDTLGSQLRVIDAMGNVVFTKLWKMPFFIKKMVFDSQDNLFFTGYFFGPLNIDGIQIESKGMMDGMVGKMDTTGKIAWIKTFGGPNNDLSNGICLDTLSKTLYITGQTTDSLFINQSYKEVQGESMLLASCTTKGDFLKYKLFDFIPSLKNSYLVNQGVEITTNSKGSLFVLADIEGDTTGGQYGRYVLKITTNFDILWKTFVTNNNECDYGWSNIKLKLAENGDAYFLRNCYSKGAGNGNGAFLRLNSNTGKEVSNYGAWNMSFSDFIIKNNQIYLIGNVGNVSANYAFINGYFFITKINDSNVILGENRIYGDANINAISMNSHNQLYITGDYYGIGKVLIGKDTLIGKNHLEFISLLKDINCTPLVLNSLPYNATYHVIPKCPGASMPLMATKGFVNYLWSDGQKGDSIRVVQKGPYRVAAINSNGCTSYSGLLTFFETPAYPINILRVTYDTLTNKNLLCTDSYYSNSYKYYKICKKTAATFIETDTSNSRGDIRYNEFADRNSDPNKGAVTYRLISVDTCGFDSEPGNTHTTMFLNASKSDTGNVLVWNRYIGFKYPVQNIYRGTNRGNLTLISTVDSATTSYLDKHGAGAQYYYQIRVGPGQSDVNKYSNSNIAKPSPNILNQSGIISAENNIINIYPNPSSGIFSIKNLKEKSSIKIFNVFGQLITKREDPANLNIDLSSFPKGIYLIEIRTDSTFINKKIVIE
jgi:hypothetical protein